ncbi:MAG: hypothetical protein Q7K28_03280 [Candidatus Wildermuthbacteria bacterium]|nr:hypothetical protein [Candidatus Wildermuthbacteria bacterium]
MSYSIQLVSQIILILSGLGLLSLIFHKVPELLSSPAIDAKKEGGTRAAFLSRLLAKVRKIGPLKDFSYDIFLQKLISRIRILTLKTDNKTLNWLQKLREKTQNKFKKEGNYWEEVKKAKDKK